MTGSSDATSGYHTTKASPMIMNCEMLFVVFSRNAPARVFITFLFARFFIVLD